MTTRCLYNVDVITKDNDGIYDEDEIGPIPSPPPHHKPYPTTSSTGEDEDNDEIYDESGN